ncbi:mycothione reductase [Paeniglutamicibacter gangotriensis]|uniref:Dihydrolipoamide dehydrogenase E3 subunit n=1 Tax=Paeniglutamicibacter gangotriensis Lz1y TaxID=1276920 RepID=M7NHX2_9MICC|nr:mycothione reductase [Paeniglutamicibacter gangotriensis]EMQ98138.1 dihydrolipoamide dehydrogenase E3 subunit [Paeniglutamicibacter gangotriensis Lz1y]
MAHYDLAIIGSGSGNSLITEYWDTQKVAIIDAGIFGGTCLNVGCIPTKMFVYPGQLAASVTQAKALGVELKFEGADWAGIRDRIFGRIDAISEAGKNYRAHELENVTLYTEHVSFVSEHELRTASGESITADKIVIATGSRAVLPEVPGISLPGVHTSDTIMRLAELPKRLVILGGGYIASEFAAVFAALGSEVVQVNRSGALMRQLDADISAAFTTAAAARWRVELDADLRRISEHDGGLQLEFEQDGAPLTLEADVVLVATGRTPNTDALGVAQLGFDLREDGSLVVDDYQRVLADGEPVPGIFGLGDAANTEQLKHVANREARVLIHNLQHPDAMRPMDRRFVPAAVFTNPQIAYVGATEAQARAQHGDAVCSVIQDYGSTAYGWAMEDEEGIVKLLAHRETGLLLGAHLMGHEAALLIQPLIQAMSMNLEVNTMARGPFWIHPALSEVVENALLSLQIPARDSDPL